MSNIITILIIVALYFIGSIIYSMLNAHRVGEVELDEDGSSVVEPEDIAFEASLWPGFLLMFIVLFPIKFLTKLIKLLCGQKKQ